MDNTATVRNNGKRTMVVLICLLLIFIVVFITGCYGAGQLELNSGFENRLVDSLRLSNDVTLSCSASRYTDSSFVADSYVVNLVSKNGTYELQPEGKDFQWIFYDLDSKAGMDNGVYAGVCTNSVYYYPTIDGKEYCIFVITAPKEIGIPFSETPYGKQTPMDSMDTDPIVLQEDSFDDGYPVWVFAFQAEDLPSDYVLNYLSFSINAEQINAHHWEPEE